MEPVLIAVYRQMLVSHPARCSADRIVADPVLRNEYLTRVRAGGVVESEYEILNALQNLRKRSKLPRRADPPVATPPTI